MTRRTLWVLVCTGLALLATIPLLPTHGRVEYRVQPIPGVSDVQVGWMGIETPIVYESLGAVLAGVDPMEAAIDAGVTERVILLEGAPEVHWLVLAGQWFTILILGAVIVLLLQARPGGRNWPAVASLLLPPLLFAASFAYVPRHTIRIIERYGHDDATEGPTERPVTITEEEIADPAFEWYSAIDDWYGVNTGHGYTTIGDERLIYWPWMFVVWGGLLGIFGCGLAPLVRWDRRRRAALR